MSIATELERIKSAKTAIKEAINAKGGTLSDELIDQYATAIANLPSGGGEIDLSFITATANDILAGKIGADSNGNPVNGAIQTIGDITVSGNVVTIPAGYNATEQTKTVGTAKGAETFTPSTADQTIAAGTYLSGVQTIKGDANLIAENIAEGVEIFGVVGTHQGGGGGSMDFYKCANVDTSAKTWTGYKAVFDAESEIWSFDASVTTGLTFGKNIVPAIEKIYNDTATITAVLYQGYPENALLINCDTLDDDRFTATNCTLSTDIKKYGTGSIKINSGGYIEFDHGADSLLDNPWTAAHFFYADSYTGGTDLKPLVNNDTDVNGSFFVAVTSGGKIRTHIRGVSYSDTQDTLSDGWHHIRVVHNGGTLKAYLDGNLIATVSGFRLNTDPLWIGKLAGSGSRQFDGYIDGIEFIPLDESTVAKYSGATAPVPANSF